MVNTDPILAGILIVIAVALVVILFGPSFYSTYRNWKIRRGERK